MLGRTFVVNLQNAPSASRTESIVTKLPKQSFVKKTALFTLPFANCASLLVDLYSNLFWQLENRDSYVSCYVSV